VLVADLLESAWPSVADREVTVVVAAALVTVTVVVVFVPALRSLKETRLLESVKPSFRSQQLV